MLALKIIGIIVLIIFLICQIRVGADIDYTGGNLRISAKFCGLLLQIYPRKASKPKEEKKAEPEKEQKPPKEKKPKRDKKKKKKEKSGPGLMISGDEILELLKRYDVKKCCYGHIHGRGIPAAFNGWRGGTEFRLVSADAVGFAPVPVFP